MMLTDTTHQCPIRGCTAQVSADKLLCFKHWKLVPSALQRAVYVAYRRAPGGAEHIRAMADAVASVDAAPGTPAIDTGARGRRSPREEG